MATPLSDMSSPAVLTKDTFIPIGAVIIVLSAAFSYGIMYNKVSTLTSEIVFVKENQEVMRTEQIRQAEETARIESKLDLLLGRPEGISYVK